MKSNYADIDGDSDIFSDINPHKGLFAAMLNCVLTRLAKFIIDLIGISCTK